ncbi:hypothetical protein Ctob_008777 [Chrysochromulina tobinii]|uniref:Methyltransferase FkbM domain-containing protein n=1 Tax=Chrysochromulina tobinii TaxID=1460289 RepID=A0A0M0JTL6_9EUKA|nr:hypothetical protein Ctob_008777 [Chrysochromulina tobinii]|eukprot:KOO29870.1 hypothetical protein Ctob_008777 [Chrysochromulina sp. CCMP291]
MLSGFGSNVTLSNSAFSNQSAVASFGIDTIHGGSVGSSLELQRHTTDVHGKKGQGPTLKDQNSLIRVRTVDAAAFLDGLGDATSRNIVLKVDVEGSEYAVLRRLIESGVLCRRVTDVFVEWHDQAANMATFRWIHSQLNTVCTRFIAPRYGPGAY